MEEFITFGESVIISGFSMLIVFAGLVIISLIISLLKVISNNDKKKDSEVVEIQKTPVKKEDVAKNDEELVAVIAAAIAASMNVGTDDIVIRKIQRTNNIDSWTKAGLSEQMLSNL